MPAVSDQSRAAITDYRWFRVGPDGLPRGARNVVWPPTAICHAEHRPLQTISRC